MYYQNETITFNTYIMETIKQLQAMNELLITLGYNTENLTMNEGLAVLSGLKAVLKVSVVLNK